MIDPRKKHPNIKSKRLKFFYGRKQITKYEKNFQLLAVGLSRLKKKLQVYMH